MKEVFNLSKIAHGGVSDVVNLKIEKLIENIMDLSTEATKSRKLVVTVTVTPNDLRTEAHVDIDVQTKLEKPKTINTKIAIEKLENGQFLTRELMNKGCVEGQTFMNEDGEVCDDRGNVMKLY